MLKQQFQLKLLQKLSPQQIQLMKLIQLPTQAFEQRIKQEIEENPALSSEKEAEENDNSEYDDLGGESNETEDFDIDAYLSDDEIPSYKLQTNNYSSDDDEHRIPYAGGISFHQSLENQLHTYTLSNEHLLIAEFLVGSIDESGYIRRELIDLVDDLAFTQNLFTTEENIALVLTSVVQKLEPVGVGARNLKECLTLQLKAKDPTKSVSLASTILENSFDPFVNKHYKKTPRKTPLIRG